MKVCSKCGESKPEHEFYKSPRYRDGLQSHCKRCHGQYVKTWQQNNPERVREKIGRWQKNHVEQRNEQVMAWRRANRERYSVRVRERVARWAKAHPEENRAKARAWRQTHPEEIRAKDRARREADPERERRKFQLRRARRAGAAGRYTLREWRALKAQYGNACLCCGRTEPEVKLTLDHIVPLACGGSNGIENIQPLCLSCNSSKGAKTVDYRPTPLLTASN